MAATSATRRPTWACSAARSSSSTGVSRPSGRPTADELATVLASLLALRDLRLRDVDGAIASSVVPAPRPRVRAGIGALPRRRAGGRRADAPDRDAASGGEPARGRGRPRGKRGRRVRALRRGLHRCRLRHDDQLRRGVGGGRVPRREHRAGRRDLDRGAVPAGRPALHDRPRGAEGGHRADDSGPLQSGVVYGFAGVRSTGSSPACARRSGAKSPRWPPAAWPRRSFPSARRSTRWTSC